MMFRNKVLMAGTTVAVLVTFGWFAANGRLWVELEAARKDPAKYLANLANDVRLSLTPTEREYVQQAATAMQAPPVAATPVATPAPQRAEVPVTPASPEAAVTSELVAIARTLAQPGRELAKVPTAVAEAEQRLKVLDQTIGARFDEEEARILAADLPGTIIERQQEARARYEADIAAVFKHLETARSSRDAREVSAAMGAVTQRLGQATDARRHQRFDPSRMPLRAAKPTGQDSTRTAMLSKAQVSADGAVAASLAPPVPADLAANEDAQLTGEIRALAASLGNEPVRIFNWVRNNIAFVPTHGSVQGSQLTLDAKRGNAYDTASLLIALLRAANVPARYVTGSVEVPIATAMNWAGVASTPAVAQELFGTGGVPNVAMTSGGKITHLRLEHVWVEAYVDFVPSRGAIHRQGDTWVPMDASFKQHTFTARSTYFTDVPFAQVLDPAVRPFDVDEELGKITNVDETALRERLAAWAETSTDYFYSHGDVPQTFDGLLGGKSIVPEESTVLAGALPYKLLGRGTAVSTLPSRLRHSVMLRGYASALDRALESPSFTVSVSLPAVNSKRLGLQFDPASPADANTLRAAREGNASSLPVYLVNVVPTVKLDGTALGGGSAIRMGSDFYLDVVLQAPEGPTVLPYEVVAGDEIVVGVTGNGVTREVVEKRFAANPVDNAPEYLHQVQLHYWMESDYFAQITAKAMDLHMLRLPSVGLFSSSLTVSSFFGIPRWGTYQQRSMDVKQTLLGAVSAVPGRTLTFMKQVGIQSSYLEGAIFDQLQDRSQGQAFTRRGISAIHLLSVAASQGIPIYNITASNADRVLPLLALDADVESDVSAALGAGKTVLVSEREVDMGPWKGVGYIITDETTGAGAYMISGGLAGGGILDCLRKLVPIFEKVGEILLAMLIALAIILIFVGALGLLGPAGAPVGAGAAAAFLLLILGRDSLDSVTPMEA